ncbi:MAG: PAS domain-containing protein [Pseudomonadota bacterium]|nr:PAS domain-containing protein [Pseudomonadota bacterium]
MDPLDVAHLLDHLGDGIFSVGADGELGLVNAAAAALLALPGEPRSDVQPSTRAPAWFGGLGAFRADRETPMAEADFAPMAAARRGEPVEQDVFLRDRASPDGRLLHLCAWPVRDASGASAGAVAVVRHAEAAGSAEAELQGRFIELLRVVAVAANDATDLDEALLVTLEAVGRAAHWSVGQALLVGGLPPRFVATTVRYVADRERYASLCVAMDATNVGLDEGLPGRVFQTGGPVVVPDMTGDPTFLRLSAAAAGLRAGFGFPILVRNEVVGVLEFFAPEHTAPDPALLDVLVQVGTLLGRVVERERARSNEAFFRAIIDHVGDPIFVKDRKHRWVVLNRALTELVQFPHDDMIGKTDHDFFPKEQADFFHAKDREMFSFESSVVVEEEPITDASGNIHWLATTKVPLRGPSGEVTHLVGIIHDITRLKIAEDDLRQKNLQLAAEVRQHAGAEAQLQAANRDLEGFCHSVSHDLRTPLRAIDGFSGMLLREHADQLDEVGRNCLRRVRKNTERMAQLMDDLLQLSRVSRSALHRQPVDLRTLAREVFEELRRREPSRRVTLSANVPLVVSADRRLVRLLLENLIGNAWKFTSLRPDAHIGLRRAGDAFCVEDDGAGFEMAYVGALFKPFSRLHGHEEFPGTGVGLATVLRIVERHGGSVWAEGEVDRGAKVCFTLGGAASAPRSGARGALTRRESES